MAGEYKGQSLSGRRIWAETRSDNDTLEVLEGWGYDRRGLLLSYQRSLHNASVADKVIQCAYDEDGSKIGQAIDGYSVSYVPDHAGRPTEISVNASPVAEDIKYLAYRPVHEMTRGAVTESFGFDHRMRSQQLLAGTNTLIDRGYIYDNTGNLKRINDSLHPERGKSFGYDELGRLRSQTVQQPSATSILSYEYDANGNRKLESEVKLVQNIIMIQWVVKDALLD